MVAPTITIFKESVSQVELIERSESSSDHCKNSSSGECEKPTSESALTIVLAVVIPVVVIIAVLGFFLFRNYRKEKKESNEHDPDFDENGEATALPDFPFSKGYEFEDPFKSQKTDRYTYYKQEINKSNASFVPNTQGKPFMDEFILPYHHQTGSKVSLDDYARQLGGFNTYGEVSRTSLNIGASSRSSISNAVGMRGAAESPQKSTLRSEINASQKSPSKTVGNKDYVNIPNYSFSQTEFQDTEDHSDLESVSDSNSSSGDNTGEGDEKIPIKYANDSHGIVNSTLDSGDNSQRRLFSQSLMETTTNESFDTTHEDFERIEPNISMNDYNFSNHNSRNEEHGEEEDTNTLPGNGDDRSPFDNESQNDEYADNEEKIDENVTESEEEEGDFDFSGRNEVPQSNSYNKQDYEKAGSDLENINAYENPIMAENAVKSPRMSAFNLLKNDSDEEDNDGEQNKEITAEQEEEIQRMKSIYKVYFDRANSQKSENPNLNKNNAFQYDESNPLPTLNKEEEIRINNQLKVDTSDKRLTTTSSIYTDLPAVNEHQEQYNQNPNQMYYDYNNQQQYQHYTQQQMYSSEQQQQQQELPPLKQLPNASDIRKSTLQTYTDFHPKMKNSITMPNLRQPYNPMEDQGVWSSPMNSPAAQSQKSFSSAVSSHQHSNNAPPSATQLSRTSVVLLNPVTEITKTRKFKPAGSIQGNNTSLPNSPTIGQQQFQQQNSFGSESELIPGNRKSDIRRMMVSNF